MSEETVKYRDLFPRREYIFYKYTQEDLDAAVLAERERCAQICEEAKKEWNDSVHRHSAIAAVGRCAAAIRART